MKRLFSRQSNRKKICPATPEGYYSTDEVAEMFKISIKHAGVITRENNIPKIALKGFNSMRRDPLTCYTTKRISMQKSQTG